MTRRCPECGEPVVHSSSNSPSVVVLSCGCAFPIRYLENEFQKMSQKDRIPIVRTETTEAGL